MGIRVIAVDWSGDQRSGRKKIWLAEAVRGNLIRLENGRDRGEIAAYLVQEAERDRQLVVGFDFAFSFPAWFCRRLGAATVRQVWELVSRAGEGWLRSCRPPFWGRRRGKKPSSHQPAFRKTEEDIAKLPGNPQPKSVLQIGGAGAVGTGSIRGMPILLQLHRAGFSIWPFDPPGWPRVIEIYPRLLTGPVTKSSLDKREAYLAKEFPDLSADWCEKASSCEDAFDAAVSALVMTNKVHELEKLGQASDPLEILEGRIWY